MGTGLRSGMTIAASAWDTDGWVAPLVRIEGFFHSRGRAGRSEFGLNVQLFLIQDEATRMGAVARAGNRTAQSIAETTAEVIHCLNISSPPSHHRPGHRHYLTPFHLSSYHCQGHTYYFTPPPPPSHHRRGHSHHLTPSPPPSHHRPGHPHHLTPSSSPPHHR